MIDPVFKSLIEVSDVEIDSSLNLAILFHIIALSEMDILAIL